MQRSPRKGPVRALAQNQWGLAILFGVAALVLGPPLLMMVLIGAKFQFLQDPGVLDQAQIARNLMDGKGWFVTSLIRPLSMGIRAEISNHPDLYNPPGYVLYLAAIYKSFGATDRGTVFGAAALWVLNIWLTFVAGLRWFDRRVAILATVFMALNVAGLVSVVQGYSVWMSTLFVMLLCLISFGARESSEQPSIAAEPSLAPLSEPAGPRRLRPRIDAVSAGPTTGPEPVAVMEPTPRPLPVWAAGAVGALLSLAFLSQYQILPAAIVLLAWLARRESILGGSPLFLGLGFAVPILPWMVRNTLVGGWPVLSLFWYEAIAATPGYPGDSVFRYVTIADRPLVYPILHPGQIHEKMVTTMAAYRDQIGSIYDPLIVALGAAYLFGRPTAKRSLQMMRWPIGLAFTATVLSSAWFRPDASVLITFTPFTSILAAASLLLVVFPRLTVRYWIGKIRITPSFLRAAVGTVTVLIVATPFWYYIRIARPATQTSPRDSIVSAARQIPSGGYILANEPAMFAWHSGRPSVMLPQRLEDLATMEQNFTPPKGAFITPQIGQFPARERGTWWFWIASGQGVFRGLRPVQGGANGVVWVRDAGGAAASSP